MKDSVISRFLERVEMHPHQTALVSDTANLTYAQLRQRAGDIATAIRNWYQASLNRSVLPSDIVGISMEKCPDLYAAIFGILEIGASYVPLDPHLPVEARQQIIERSNCELILVDGLSIPTHSQDSLITVSNVLPGSETLAPAVIMPTELCYVIFTSGSTGKPKGVMVNHSNVLNLVDWCSSELEVNIHTRGLQYSTINFDASVLDIFPILLNGGCLLIPTHEQRLSASGLMDFCRRHNANHAFLPPSLLTILSPTEFRGITTLLTGGEACSPAVIQQWSAERSLYNLFGPTECTVLAAFKKMDNKDLPSNIGSAISGVRLHVLDEFNIPSSRGELYIGGNAVSPGYLGDQSMTSERYVNIPSVDSGRLYRTGDIVERDHVGDLHFLGRRDRQIKVRGYRVELEEIEETLRAIGCREAVVKFSSDDGLVAYVSGVDAMSETHLKTALTQHLADYKVPQHIVVMSRLPVKINGKIDYAGLPESHIKSVIKTEDFEFENMHLSVVIRLCASELRLDPSNLDLTSNFRDLGGTSIQIVSLLDAIEKYFGVAISFINFFRQPTIEFLCQSLQQTKEPSC